MVLSGDNTSWAGPSKRVLSTHRGELFMEDHDERLTDRGIDLAIAASNGAHKTQGQLLHNLLHDPECERLTRGIISNFFVST